MSDRKSFFEKEPQLLRDILQTVFQKAGLADRWRHYQFFSQFPDLFPAISEFCQPVDFREGILFLTITDPLYTLEVNKNVPEIILRYNERGFPVKRVKIRCSG